MDKTKLNHMLLFFSFFFFFSLLFNLEFSTHSPSQLDLSYNNLNSMPSLFQLVIKSIPHKLQQIIRKLAKNANM